MILQVKSVIRKRSVSPNSNSQSDVVASDKKKQFNKPKSYIDRPSRHDILKAEEQTLKPQKVLDPSKQAEILNTRNGGAYIPPAKMRMLQKLIVDKSSEEYQRLTWDALKKSLNGLVNKANVQNIKNIIPEIFNENLIRGKGILCKSILKAQHASITFTNVYAALISVVNTKLPQIGELLINRLIYQFRRAYQRNDKTVCLANVTFIAHLANQQVCSEVLPLQILALLLERPTDDSVEVAIGLIKECGQHIQETSPKAAFAIFERLRSILNEESSLSKRVQYMIEVIFQIRKEKFKNNEALIKELDLIEEDDQIVHLIGLDDDVKNEESLNVFKYDPEYLENELKYEEIKKEILGEDEESGDEKNSDSSNSSDKEEDEISQDNTKIMSIQDRTGTNLVNLRRTIYLTIMSSVDFEECAHKLIKINLQPGDEMEFCSMIVECCSQERTYVTFYGLLGERFCKLNTVWQEYFEKHLVDTFENIHRYETNRIRNIAKFYAHLIATDSIALVVLSIIKLSEDETTSSSRIFIKILLLELVQILGVKEFKLRISEDEIQNALSGMFPTNHPRNIRFAINYFTSIGLGQLTQEMRQNLKNLPKEIQNNDSESDTSSDDSSDSDSESDSNESNSSGSES